MSFHPFLSFSRSCAPCLRALPPLCLSQAHGDRVEGDRCWNGGNRQGGDRVAIGQEGRGLVLREGPIMLQGKVSPVQGSSR